MDQIKSLWRKRKALQEKFEETAKNLTPATAQELLKINEEIQDVSSEIQKLLHEEFKSQDQ
ncbi:MAG TPA: hypothetical protein VFM18_21550 [Methanosarcina sp.]|nr:hypothetical protein [Methanosarcina sp.]